MQVWAVGEDRGLYFRMGVTQTEPSGSGWIPVLAQWGSGREAALPRSVIFDSVFSAEGPERKDSIEHGTP